MTEKFHVTKQTPTEPNPGRTPADVVFINLGRMIIQNKLTDVEANRLLDEWGVDPDTRFWGAQTTVNPTTGRFSTHFFNWVNGGWVNGTKQRQQEIRKNMDLKTSKHE